MAIRNNTIRSSGASASTFFSFRQDWAALGRFFEVVARIPGDPKAFQIRYGAFPNESSVNEFLNAVCSVGRIASAMGGPEAFGRCPTSVDDKIFATASPDDVYTQLVRLTNEIGSAAHTLGSVFPVLKSLLSPAISAVEKAAKLRWALSGSESPAKTAEDIAGKIDTLRRVLALLTPQFLSTLQAFNKTEVINQANVALGALRSSIDRLGKQSIEAKKKTCKWLRKTKTERASIELVHRIADANEDLTRKQKLVDDTSTLFSTGNHVVPALMSIDEKLRFLAKIFTDVSERINTVTQISNTTQLSDYQWLTGALDFPDSWTQWREIEEAALKFVQEATADIGLKPANPPQAG